MSAAFLECPNQWPPDSQACVFLARALPLLPTEALWAALVDGNLEARVYCVGRTDFAPIPLSRMALIGVDRDQVLARCQIEVREDDTRRPAAIRRRIAVPHWLYVTKVSLDNLLKAQPNATVAAEGRAVAHLADQLRRNPNMTKAEGRTACAAFKLGGRAFERIWPQARIKAGLPPKAAAGRKSPH